MGVQTCRVPKCQLDLLAVNLDVGDIVFEHGWDIHLATAKGNVREERAPRQG